jgi:hypothetical protein
VKAEGKLRGYLVRTDAPTTVYVDQLGMNLWGVRVATDRDDFVVWLRSPTMIELVDKPPSFDDPEYKGFDQQEAYDRGVLDGIKLANTVQNDPTRK